MSDGESDLISLSTQGSCVEENENDGNYPKYQKSEISGFNEQGSYIGVDADKAVEIDAIANDLGKIRNSIISEAESQGNLEESNSKTSKVSNCSQIGQSKQQRKSKKKLQNYRDSMDVGGKDFDDDRWNGGGGEDEDDEEIADEDGELYQEFLAAQGLAHGETQRKDSTAGGGGCCVIM